MEKKLKPSVKTRSGASIPCLTKKEAAARNLLTREELYEIHLLPVGEPAAYSYVDENQVENSILITEQDKEYLYFPEDEDDNEPDIVLPELEDGHYYELEGKINRVTEKTCSLGFFYKGHTITSIPVDKQLATYKNSFLSKRSNQVLARVRISGIIERKDSSSGFMRNRPVMNFDKLELLDDEYEEGELF
jgi:hypothetical protein